jgi:2-aminoethylphosphonate-pyruvate transaminase
MEFPKVKRNVLLNPGPSTTTDTVKYAQVVPDICPREKEFGDIMKQMGEDLVKIVHGDPEEYTAVLFCGSGTLCIDSCVSSLVPEGKKILVCSNGSYSARAAEIARYYHIDNIELKMPIDRPVDVNRVREALEKDSDIAVVYCCMHETGTGILNPVRELGALAHEFGCIMVSDTTSAYAMIPIDIKKDNLDFIMASAQKGLQSMTGLSYVIGRTDVLEASKDYPTHSYYTNLYMQYSFIRDKGQMHFTPPVQTIYATRQAIKEYFAIGEKAKWERHQAVWNALYDGAAELGLKPAFPKELVSRLVLCLLYPDDPAFDFEKVHDYVYERGFTIYPGKVTDMPMFRVCSLGAITPEDIKAFYAVLREALEKTGVRIPCVYNK